MGYGLDVSKFLSQRVQSVPPSGIRRFFDIAASMPNVISLSVGEPDFVTPDRFRQAAVDSIQGGDTGYTANAGVMELRELTAKELQRLYGVSYDPVDELNVTVGVSEAMTCAAVATIDPGDEVIVPEPCFVAYKPNVIFSGGVPVVVTTSAKDNFEVDPDQIEAAITPRTKAILIGFPNNPTGAVMSRERMLRLAEIVEKHDLLVFSDEIYDRLVYGTEHVCFASLPGMRERTIHLGGFSKSHAMTGWRIGYVAAPKEIAAQIRKVHQFFIMSAPTAGQAAAIEALKTGEPEVQHMVSEYDKRRKVLLKGLNDLGLPTFEPKGAFYCFPDIRPTGLTSMEFCEGLVREHQVAVVPGSAFGECGEGFARVCYASSMANIEEALKRMKVYVDSLLTARR